MTTFPLSKGVQRTANRARSVNSRGVDGSVYVTCCASNEYYAFIVQIVMLVSVCPGSSGSDWLGLSGDDKGLELDFSLSKSTAQAPDVKIGGQQGAVCGRFLCVGAFSLLSCFSTFTLHLLFSQNNLQTADFMMPVYLASVFAQE